MAADRAMSQRPAKRKTPKLGNKPAKPKPSLGTARVQRAPEGEDVAPASHKAAGDDFVAKRRRQRRSIDTRKRIIDAALTEFSERGFDGASTRAVADAAGIRHTLVNYHFDSKEGLYRAVMTTVLDDYLGVFRERLQGLRGVDDVIRLRLLQEEFICFVANNPRFNQIMAFEARQSSDRLNWLVVDLIKPIFAAITPLIESAQKSGHYVEGDPYHLQYLFIGATTRIFMLSAEVEAVAGWLPAGEDFLQKHIDACLSLFFRTPAEGSEAASR